MFDNWKIRLRNFVDEADEMGIYKIVQKVGNPASAKSTVYQLSKRFPEFIWKHNGDLVEVFLPRELSLKERARRKWDVGAKEKGVTDASWPPNPDVFVGDPYTDSLEELADLYNYTVVSRAKGEIANNQATEIINSIHALYNKIRYANEYLNVEGFRRTD